MNAPTLNQPAPYEGALIALRAQLGVRMKPQAQASADIIADQLARVSAQRDSVADELDQINAVVKEALALQSRRGAELAELTATCDQLIASKAALDQIR